MILGLEIWSVTSLKTLNIVILIQLSIYESFYHSYFWEYIPCASSQEVETMNFKQTAHLIWRHGIGTLSTDQKDQIWPIIGLLNTLFHAYL